MTVKTKSAEALFPLLSLFHEVNGLSLRAVRQSKSEDARSSIEFDFESKALIVRADEKDDTVEFWVADSPMLERLTRDNASLDRPWKDYIGKDFGWGWVTVNQQGYLDGIILSFGEIMPQLIITAVASSLKVGQIRYSIQSGGAD